MIDDLLRAYDLVKLVFEEVSLRASGPQLVFEHLSQIELIRYFQKHESLVGRALVKCLANLPITEYNGLGDK